MAGSQSGRQAGRQACRQARDGSQAGLSKLGWQRWTMDRSSKRRRCGSVDVASGRVTWKCALVNCNSLISPRLS